MAYNGKPSGSQTALHKGKQWRRIMRIEKAALLSSKGIFSNEQIAAFIGIHPQTLIYLKQTPEFKSRMISLQTGIIEQHDLHIREDEEYQAQELKGMVPIALQKLRELLLSGNQHIALKATQDVLDREGTHAKVSRSAIDIKDNTDINVLDSVAKSIQDILINAPRSLAMQEEETKLAKDLLKSAADIDAEFTKGATDSTSQLYIMEESITKETLESLDVKKLKIN